MAIPFLNNINLSDNQLLNAKLQITGTAPAAEQGQIYFNSATGFLKPRVHDGSAWLNLLDTTSIINGTYITSTVINNVDLTLDLSAVDGTAVAATRFLSKDNTWDVPVDTNTQETYTLPVSVGTGLTGYTVADINLTAAGTSTGVKSTVTFAGENDNIKITKNVGNNGRVNISLADSIYIRDSLTVAGVYTQTGFPISENVFISGLNMSSKKITNVLDPTSAQDAATKQYVDSAVTGLLQFVGGFDANTGILDDGSGDDLYTDVVIQIGDYYVVTTDGNFFGNTATPLTVGDSVIAQNAVLDPGTTAPVEGDFIVVQSDTDLATLSTVGIGNVNAGTGISVSYASGTATVSLTAVAARSGSIAVPTSTTYTYPNSITAASTNDVLIQLVDSGTGETVYADVTRLSTTTFSIDYGVTEPTGVIALIQLIG